MNIFIKAYTLIAVTLFPFVVEAYYPNPGIVVNREGKWVGSDHLFNLSNEMDVVAEVVAPEGHDLPVTEEELRQYALSTLNRANLAITPSEGTGGLHYPFFHLLVMITPTKSGYAVYCEGRVFEKVKLDRVNLRNQGIMQGITWESQNLIFTGKEEFREELFAGVNEILSTFAERFQFYKSIQERMR